MTSCTVEWHYGALLVTFDDGSDLLLQTDSDIRAFCKSCGEDVDTAEDITSCPDEYHGLASE